MQARRIIFVSLIFLVTGFLTALFFYHLNFTALQSYDEAWYADIARNIAATGNPFRLIFNAATFNDHPPLGFILMAIPTWLFGSNEFSARFVSAVLGMGSVVLIYEVGKLLKNIYVGLGAAAILLSCLWFMLRARSGNLDVPFVFWSLLTFYSLLQLKNNIRYLYLATASFAALFLTKTLVGVGILPVFLFSLWLYRKNLTPWLLLKNALLWLALVAPWYIYNQWLDPTFLRHHFIEVGVRGNHNNFGLAALTKSLFYLRVGVGKWYKVFWLSLVLSAGLGYKVKNDRRPLQLLILFFLGFAAPFLLSAKTEVWHLIPTYPAVALLIAFCLPETLRLLLPKIKQRAYVVSMAGIVLLSAYQFKQSANLIYQKTLQFSAEKDISLKAAGQLRTVSQLKTSGQPKVASQPTIYLMETFYPAAVYYSGAKVMPLHLEKDAYQQMVGMLAQNDGSTPGGGLEPGGGVETGGGVAPGGGYVFIINNLLKAALERDQVSFTVMGENESYYLIR